MVNDVNIKYGLSTVSSPGFQFSAELVVEVIDIDTT